MGLFRFTARGEIRSLSLLPEPSTEQDSQLSTVRFRAPGDVLVVYANRRGIRIDRFEVT